MQLKNCNVWGASDVEFSVSTTKSLLKVTTVSRDDLIKLAMKIAGIMGAKYPDRKDDILSAALYCVVAKQPPEDVRCEEAWWVVTLRGYVRNEISQRLKANAKQLVCDIPCIGSSSTDITDFVDTLPEIDQTIVKMRANGYKNIEIAEKLRWNKATISKHMNNIRALATKYLGE